MVPLFPSDVEFLEHCRSVYQGKIDRFLCPGFEKAFREWAEAITAPQPGEKVQRTRTSEHAERLTDLLLDFENERNRRVEEYQRLIDRIDDVLEERAGEFMTGSAALKWVLRVSCFGSSLAGSDCEGLLFNNNPSFFSAHASFLASRIFSRPGQPIQGAPSFGAAPTTRAAPTTTAQPRRTDGPAFSGLAVGLAVALPPQKYGLARAGVT